MKAIETTATLTANGQLTLDQPLRLAHQQRVRVIILISETEEDLDDTPKAEVLAGLYRAIEDVKAGRISPIETLWDENDD